MAPALRMTCLNQRAATYFFFPYRPYFDGVHMRGSLMKITGSDWYYRIRPSRGIGKWGRWFETRSRKRADTRNSGQPRSSIVFYVVNSIQKLGLK
ncbi:hypothetical protein ACN38_g5074 [Penicillium nordicum]|uniref:Uncharacterized protein n=1 Tax=Penicillium nordicum TaxID=229535 RepID=A0A0M9WGI4_9EURO|nr:hypothetical protein ACN38_g5074 [Penicillium nordicum]